MPVLTAPDCGYLAFRRRCPHRAASRGLWLPSWLSASVRLAAMLGLNRKIVRPKQVLGIQGSTDFVIHRLPNILPPPCFRGIPFIPFRFSDEATIEEQTICIFPEMVEENMWWLRLFIPVPVSRTP